MKINECAAADVKCATEALPTELRSGVKSIRQVALDGKRFDKHLKDNNIKCGVERNKLFHGAGDVMFHRTVVALLLHSDE